jgi:pyruvate/2-oxoglutarate dehydrogenase complex dihydrolipoamide acyltransferase (E2) component
MDFLWLANPTVTESMLMASLRHLHAVIEGNMDAKFVDEIKKIYWNAGDE